MSYTDLFPHWERAHRRKFSFCNVPFLHKKKKQWICYLQVKTELDASMTLNVSDNVVNVMPYSGPIDIKLDVQAAKQDKFFDRR